MKSRSGLILASQVAGVLYLLWRVGWTHEGANPVLFVLLLAVDVVIVTRHFLRIRARSAGPSSASLAASSADSSPPPSLRRGMAPIAAVLLDVGQEPLVEVRVAMRACMELRGATSITVIDRLGRSDVAELCHRFRVDRRVPTAALREANIATEVMNDSQVELIAVVPASVWAPADTIELAAALLDQPHLSAVGVPAGVLGGDHRVGTGGYPLFPELDSPYPGATAGVVVLRVDLIRKMGGFLTGNGDFVSRTLDDLNDGFAESVSLGSGIVNRPAPWDEDLALRRRVDEVGRQQTARDVHRLIEAWAVVPRAFVLCLPAVVAVSGWLPFTTSIASAAVFGLPWFVLAGLSRMEMRATGDDRPKQHWSDLRAGMRTLTADGLGLARASSLAVPPGQIAARHLRVISTFAVLAIVASFAQLLGFHLDGLGDLAAISVVLSAVTILGFVRDSVWAQADRERRILPRSTPTQTNGAVSGLSPYGADISESFAPGTELAFRLSLPQPGRNNWERNVTGVVMAPSNGAKLEGRGGGRCYAQFDLDTETLDQLLYFCGVTSPSLARLSQSVPAVVVSLRKTGRQRSVDPRRLDESVIRSRGSFEHREVQ